MTNLSVIQDFLSQHKLVLVGASTKSRKFGNLILKDLKEKGYQVFPVHPSAATIEGEKCYPALSALPEPAGGIVTCVPPQQTEKLVQEAARAGIKRIWMQQGSESSTAIDFCKQNNISVVHGECILMFATPIAFPHRLHRWIWKLLGKLPG